MRRDGRGVEVAGGRGGRIRLRTVVLATVPSAGLWLLLVGTASAHEASVGIFAVLFATATLFAMRRCYPESPRIRWRDLLPFWQVPFTVLADTVTVTRVLLRDLTGGAPAPSLYRTVRWEHGSDQLLERGRGVLATVAMTASPNSIVLGIDSQQSRMVLHQVSREPVNATARALGARP